MNDGEGIQWEDTSLFGRIAPGTKVFKGEALFQRFEADKEIEIIGKLNDAYLEKIKADRASEEPEKQEEKIEFKELITIDDFAKLDLRVAKVIKVEKHPKANRLLVLQLQVGSETRQVVSGIAESYSPEDLIGKSLILVANLTPVKLRGIESQGMILAASNNEKLVLGTLDQDIADGTQIS
jgi:methionyl-tRNA synthetase